MKEEEYLSIRDSIVRKSNFLILNSRFKLSLQQQKIIFYLTSRIEPDDEEFKEYTFKIADFCRVCGVDNKGGKQYESLRESVQTLADKSIWITLDDGRETLLRFIEKPYIDQKSGTIQIEIDRDMKPYLLNLRKNYTQFELLYTLRFKKKSSPRLYEILKSRHYNKMKPYVYEIPVDLLKELLAAENETYKEYRYFNRDILKPAVKEINEQTDLDVTYKTKKDGRNVVAIIFTIETKAPEERLRIGDEIDVAFGNPQLTLAYKIQQKRQKEENNG